MRLKSIGAGPHTDIAVSGNAVTVAGMVIDCGTEQRDERMLIDLYSDGNTVSRENIGKRIAAVEIPPRGYNNDHQPLPLASKNILLTLWEV